MKLTIIVPCYNMGKYLRRCLQSIADEYSQNFETICVNDGSTDDTEKIFHDFKYDDEGNDLYPWLSMIYQENQGLSGARNTGMANAKGEYLTFVDPDDMVAYAGIKKLIACAEKHQNPDWVLGGHKYIKTNSEHSHLPSEEFEKTGDDVPLWIYENVEIFYYSSTWGKLYKSSLIKKHNLQFVPRMIRGQDMEFNFRYLRLVKSVAICAYETYLYFYNDESVSARFKGQPRLDAIARLIETRISVVKEISPDAKLEKFMALERQFIKSLMLVTLISIYYDKSVKGHRGWLYKLFDLSEKIDRNWTEELCDFGLEGKIKTCRRKGKYPVHILMTICRLVPKFRRRLRDMLI